MGQGKKAGGRKGHGGTVPRRTETPGHIEHHYPEVCAHCGHALSEEHPCFGSSPDPGFSGGFRVSGSRFSTPFPTGGRRAGRRGRPGRGCVCVCVCVCVCGAVRAGAGGPVAGARPDGWLPTG